MNQARTLKWEFSPVEDIASYTTGEPIGRPSPMGEIVLDDLSVGNIDARQQLMSIQCMLQGMRSVAERNVRVTAAMRGAREDMRSARQTEKWVQKAEWAMSKILTEMVDEEMDA